MKRVDPISQDEQHFLREVLEHRRDEGPRLVYRDWLEDHQDQRAEYVRLETVLAGLDRADPQWERSRKQLRSLRGKLQRSWRKWLIGMSQTRIENCPHAEAGLWESEPVEFNFVCPKTWDRLTTTHDDTVRFCDCCREHVFFCENVQEANRLASHGACVALDASLARRDNDVHGFRMMLGRPALPKRLLKFRDRQ